MILDAERHIWNAAEAKRVKENAQKDYPSIREDLSLIDRSSFEGEGVTYLDDGTILLKYKN